ncbi:DUF7289 family protein [Halostella salina]|uniref:DUF7289 family protein n=1 Tax=Halostella salina TaxID=1547897 RepID=UPI000EF83A87|nr:hypothetical protein [Halostella salina]
MRGTDRGVSDMIAFVIIFSLIITSVGITYTFGYSNLTDYQEYEQQRNAERAFVALSNNVGEIEDTHVEARASELRLAGGTLSVSDDTRVAVSTPKRQVMGSRGVGQLTYEYEGTTVAYENGAVFRNGGGSRHIMLSEPRYQCGDSHAMVSVVELLNAENGSLSSDGTAQVLAELDKSSLRYPVNRTGENTTEVDYVDVTVESEKAEAWSDYFGDDSNGWEIVDSNGDEIEVRCGEDGDGDSIDLYVRQTRIDVEYFA